MSGPEPAFRLTRRLTVGCAAVFSLLALSGCFLFVTPDEQDAAIARCGRDDGNYYQLRADDSFSCMRIRLPAVPAKKPCPAVVIFPGGAYGVLAIDKEGNDYAEFLNRHGIAGIVVKYPLGSMFGHYKRHPAMLEAAQRSIRLVRYHAAHLGIDPDRIGVMGSSAGGHLAGLTMIGSGKGDPDSPEPVERVSARPDFAVLCYPVVTMSEKCAHRVSRDNLAGSDPPPELLDKLSLEKNIPADCPPVFLWLTLEDKTVDPENSRMLEAALKSKKVFYRAYFYPKGPHGMGLLNGSYAEKYPETAQWPGELLKFLREIRVPVRMTAEVEK